MLTAEDRKPWLGTLLTLAYYQVGFQVQTQTLHPGYEQGPQTPRQECKWFRTKETGCHWRTIEHKMILGLETKPRAQGPGSFP